MNILFDPSPQYLSGRWVKKSGYRAEHFSGSVLISAPVRNFGIIRVNRWHIQSAKFVAIEGTKKPWPRYAVLASPHPDQGLIHRPTKRRSLRRR